MLLFTAIIKLHSLILHYHCTNTTLALNAQNIVNNTQDIGHRHHKRFIIVDIHNNTWTISVQLVQPQPMILLLDPPTQRSSNRSAVLQLGQPSRDKKYSHVALLAVSTDILPHRLNVHFLFLARPVGRILLVEISVERD